MKTTTKNDKKQERTIITIDQSQEINEDVLNEMNTDYETVINEFEDAHSLVEGFTYYLDSITQEYAAGYIADYLHSTAAKRYKKLTGRKRKLDSENEFPVYVELKGDEFGRGVEAEIFAHLQEHQKQFHAVRDALKS